MHFENENLQILILYLENQIMIYKVWTHIEEIDGSRNHYLDLGTPYKAGRFNTEAEAVKFVEKELMIIRPINSKLQKVCQQMLDTLDVGGEQSRQFAEEIEMLKDALMIKRSRFISTIFQY